MKKYKSDEELLELLMQSNHLALKQLYEKYFSLVFSFFLKESSSKETAKDLSQDVFLKLWNIREKLIITDSLKNYLFRIAKNTYIDYIRRAINQKVFDLLNDNIHVYEEDFNSFDQDIITELINIADQMPDKRKEVFHLRWVEGLSRKEIAEKMGISIVTVDIHIRKAVDFLKQQVKSGKLAGILFLFI